MYAGSKTSQNSAPRLRLVGRDEPRAEHPRRAEPERAALRGVAQENYSASAMHSLDARVEFAAEVKAQIEGGRAAILRPERREALFVRARARGLRPFDANLVIAVVQEAARRGEDATVPQGTAQAGHANMQVLSTLMPKPKASTRDEVVRLAVIAAGIAVCILAGLISAMGW